MHFSAVLDTYNHTAAALMAPHAKGCLFLQQQPAFIGLERPILNSLLLLGDGGHQRLRRGSTPLLCTPAATI